MYSVSAKYKVDMKARVQEFNLDGTIGAVNFDESNLTAFDLTNQCSDDGQITLGSTYIGSLTANFVNVNINRYKWKGKVIRPYHIRKFSDGTSERVPLGVFTIDEATWSADGMSVTAYDNMSKLDKDVTFNATIGNPWSFLNTICTDCNISLGMTRAQVEALPNGTLNFALPADTDIATYRDLLCYLSTMLAAYSTIDRSGALVLRTYGTQSVDTILPQHRWTGGTFEDYETRYSAVSASRKEKLIRVTTPDDQYLDMDIGANPFLENMTEAGAEAALERILTALQNIDYVPFTMPMIGDPAYDLGDVVIFADGLGDATKKYCIQRYDYTLHGGYNSAGFGEDPKTRVKTKDEKELAAQARQAVQNEIQYYIFRNTRDIAIGNNQTKSIMVVHFASLKATMVVFHAEILLETETIDGATIGVVTYLRNSVEITDYHPTETWIDGDHVLHLLYHIELGEAELYHWDVRMTMQNGSALVKKVQASISGQGLVATDEWIGYLEFEDNVGLIGIDTTPTPKAYVEQLTAGTNLPDVISFTENVGAVKMRTTPTPDEYFPALYVNKGRLKDLTWGEVKEYTWAEILEMFNW